MTSPAEIFQDARFLAQERITEALLRALALNSPDLRAAVRAILVDTGFGHSGKPDSQETVHQQIRKRLGMAAAVAAAYGRMSVVSSERQSIRLGSPPLNAFWRSFSRTQKRSLVDAIEQ